MGFKKFGTGEILPEEGDLKKEAATWTEQDSQELAEENAEADEKQD